MRSATCAAAVASIDSDGAHGGVIGPEAMKIAIERARRSLSLVAGSGVNYEVRTTVWPEFVTPQRLAAEADRWAPRFVGLPRPWTAVIVGGNSGPYTLGRKAARRLAAEASEFAAGRGGSLLVTTSARTAPAAMQELMRRLVTIRVRPYYLHQMDPVAEPIRFISNWRRVAETAGP